MPTAMKGFLGQGNGYSISASVRSMENHNNCKACTALHGDKCTHLIYPKVHDLWRALISHLQ